MGLRPDFALFSAKAINFLERNDGKTPAISGKPGLKKSKILTKSVWSALTSSRMRINRLGEDFRPATLMMSSNAIKTAKFLDTSLVTRNLSSLSPIRTRDSRSNIPLNRARYFSP